MTYIKSLLLITLYFLSSDLLAGVFDVIPTDASKGYLGIIFGGSVGPVSLGGGGNPILSKMFERFNFIIVTFGVLIVSYVGVVAAINTAREGEAMGKKFSLWVPLRGLFGMLMMLPSPGTGYSVVQMTVIWIVLNGIGAANAIWNVVLDQLASGVQVVGKVELPDIRGDVTILTKAILDMKTCQNVLNRLDIDLTKNYGPVKINIIPSPPVITNANANIMENNQVVLPIGSPQVYTQQALIKVGVESNDVTSSRQLDNLCGEIPVQTSLNYSDPDFSLPNVSKRLEIKLNAVKAIFDAIEPAAEALSQPAPSSPTAALPEAPRGTFQSAYQNYMAQLVQLATGRQTAKTQRLANQVKTLKSFGWIHAGGYYFSMSQGSAADIGDAAQVPTASDVPTFNRGFTGAQGGPPSGFSITLDPALQNNPNRLELNRSLGLTQTFFESDSEFTSPGLPSLGSNYPSTGNKILNKVIKALLQGIRTPIFKFFSKELTGKKEDPLISIGSFGTTLMLASEMSTFLMIVLSMTTMLAVSSGSCLSPLAWAFNTLFYSVLPFMAGILLMLWTIGATLGVYIPMVPYLVFTATAIGWMLAVIEAIVGAPIIALGLVQPSGEELGKIAPALGILVNIFLRPTLMIFGFMIAGSLLRAILTMINFGFISALNTAVPYPTFFSIAPTLAMYTFLIIAVVNQSFSLIYELPNKILRFMGIQPEGGTPEKIVSETKGGFDAGAKGAQEFQKGEYDSANKKIGEQKKAAKEKKGGGQLPSQPGGNAPANPPAASP